jgi:acetolactate synthase small subunit
MNQTAVEKLIEQLTPILDRSKISDTMLHNLIEEHLAMEKQQIIQAYYQNGWNDNDNEHNAEQYYNLIYKPTK